MTIQWNTTKLLYKLASAGSSFVIGLMKSLRKCFDSSMCLFDSQRLSLKVFLSLIPLFELCVRN